MISYIYMISYIPIIDDIGFFGPMILFTLTIIMLWGRLKYINIYLIFILFNTVLNNMLKNVIKSPRPGEPDEYMIYKTYEITSGNEKYGMPSGHAQSVSFSTIYMYMVTKSKNLLIFSSFISALSLVQRYRFKRHSINQLFIGIIVGSSFAYISHNLSTFFLTCK
jgi:membrane-associated phospholipid phosphatase